MTEYPALIYKNQRSNVYMANCIAKNLTGFGKTEEEALSNLKETIETIQGLGEINLKPTYGLLA